VSRTSFAWNWEHCRKPHITLLKNGISIVVQFQAGNRRKRESPIRPNQVQILHRKLRSKHVLGGLDANLTNNRLVWFTTTSRHRQNCNRQRNQDTTKHDRTVAKLHPPHASHTRPNDGHILFARNALPPTPSFAISFGKNQTDSR